MTSIHNAPPKKSPVAGQGFPNTGDPFDLLGEWFEEAARAEPRDPAAAQLATVDADGLPNVRTVLVRGWDREGFVFYTNFHSAKGRELLAARKGALLFYWKSLSRQVRFRGNVAPVTDAAADAYFASRPRMSQIGAHASRQSEPLTDRGELETRIAACEERFAGGPVPRPSHWSGFVLAPVSIELWQERPYRLHDRLEFRLDENNAWRRRLLYP
jgi:pyridoxamine 5'-phosphate oxidase